MAFPQVAGEMPFKMLLTVKEKIFTSSNQVTREAGVLDRGEGHDITEARAQCSGVKAFRGCTTVLLYSLLYYCTTTVLCYCTTVLLLYYCTTLLLYYYYATTVLLLY